MDMFWTCFSGK